MWEEPGASTPRISEVAPRCVLRSPKASQSSAEKEKVIVLLHYLHKMNKGASLVADDSVQRVAGVIQDGQKLLCGSLLCHCLQTIQLEADHRASLYSINTMR
ncbi:unnamed protein product [Arctogadus glacialis]